MIIDLPQDKIGHNDQLIIHTDDNKTDLICATLLALEAVDKTQNQSIKLGNVPSVSSFVSNLHFAGVATIVSQPHAAPQAVDAYHISEKYNAGVDAPAAVALNGGYTHAPYAAPYHAAPYHVTPVVHVAPAPHHAPDPYQERRRPLSHAPITMESLMTALRLLSRLLNVLISVVLCYAF